MSCPDDDEDYLDDEDALAAQREISETRNTTGKLFRRPSSPKIFQSSQPFGSSSPAPLGNPFLLEDDIDEDSGDAAEAIIRSSDDFEMRDLPVQRALAGHVEALASDGTPIRIGKRKRRHGQTVFTPDLDENHASKSRHYGIAIHSLISESHSMATMQTAEAQQNVLEDCEVVKKPEVDMWVDKYRPKKFTELLGDERTNRDVMRWIRHWDYCVFGRAVQQNARNKVFSGHDNDSLMEVEKDPHNRPERRILMLTGPPGLGKTTLAHIAARQAGYNVIEINASDDRTGTVVQNKIGDALGSQAVFNPRPSLIVIDEIDGVSASGGEAGFIRSLLKFLVDDEKTTAQNRSSKFSEHALLKKKKSKRKTSQALLRPIICICNDQYVAALRPLRQYCQFINFRPLSIPTVVARLAKICRYEGMQADARALNALCEIADSDLRSCVNSLQYVRMKSTTFTLQSVAHTLAKKDTSRSSHSVVEAVFKLLDAKKERKKGNVSSAAAQDNITRIAELATTNNEFSKILNGCFAQYPSSSYHDSLFSKPVEASNWLFFHDRCERGVYESQHGELLNYMPYPIAAFHHLFATHEGARTLERSKSDWEAREKTRINNEILSAWISGVKASLRQIFTPLTFASELLTYGIRIVGTNLNPANSHLIKASDRAVLRKVVDAMIALGLHYNQYKVEDGSYIFRLEPPLPQVMSYEGVLELKGESLLPSRYAARQIISSELAAEKIRRSLEAQGHDQTSDQLSVQPHEIRQAAKRKALEELSAQPAMKRDFFGRPIQLLHEDSVLSVSSNKVLDKPKASVHIKFSDGFSDAVRNNISIQELLNR